jgi:YHS domain-containing protein
MTFLNKTLALALVLSFSNAMADSLLYSTENGAIDGYDPVSYFVEGAAERGAADITTEWNGAVWHFSSYAHRDMFIEDPEKFVPQYGGFCALGMAHGGAVPTNPEAWTIHDGKLYLNMIEEVTITWRYNPDKLIKRADLKWQTVNSD